MYRFFLLGLFVLGACRMPATFTSKQDQNAGQYRLPGSDCRAKKEKYSYGGAVRFTIKNNCSYRGIELSRKDEIYYSLSSKQISLLNAGNPWGSIVRGITAWSAQFYGDGNLQHLSFRYPQMVNGILWTELYFAPDGKIERGLSAGEIEVNGLWVQSGSWLYFNPDGKPRVDSYVLSREQEVQGVWWAKGSGFTFSPEGVILYGQLAPRGATIDGVELKGGTMLRRFANGKIQEATLAKPHLIQGFMVEGIVIFYESGKLQTSILSAESKVGDFLIPAKTQLRLSGEGALVSAEGLLTQETMVGDVSCPAGYTVYFERTLLKQALCLQHSSYVIFDEEGRLYSITLGRDQVIQGVSYRANYALQFSTKGKILSGMLAETAKIDGQSLPKDTMFYVKEDGALVSVSVLLTQDSSLFGASCKAGEVITAYRAPKGALQGFCAASWPAVHEGGALSSTYLTTPLVVQGVPCAAMDIYFHPNGQLQTCYLSKAAPVQGVVLAKDSVLSLFENGKLQLIYLAEPQLIQKILFEGELEFYENGKVAYGALARDAIIQGKKFSAGDFIELDESGKLFVDEAAPEPPLLEKRPMPGELFK